MKTILTFIAVATISTAAHAQQLKIDNGGCCDLISTEVVCQDVRGHNDDTLTVIIQSGGFIGMTRAEVSEGTLAGRKPLGTIAVSRIQNDPNLDSMPGNILYTGKKFRLQIDMLHNHDEQFVGHLKAKIDGQSYSEEMTCRFVE